MKIKVGDRVKFLNDVGAGEVTRILDQKTALVQIDGGFEVPTMINELVVDRGTYDADEDDSVVIDQDTGRTSDKQSEKTSFSEIMETDSSQAVILDEEVLLAFLPDANSSSFESYLINSSSYHFKYTIARQQEGEMVLYHEGELEPGIKINLGEYLPGNLKDEETFRVQGIFFNAGFYMHLPPVDVLFNVLASELYQSTARAESDYFLSPAIFFDIHKWGKEAATPAITIDPDEIRKAMYTKGDIKAKKVEIKQEQLEEVDLHIEKLVDNSSDMDNQQIMDVQLARFRTSLDSALIHKTKKIVFIHGVGNGKLKHEIRRILESEYKKVRFQDASFREYGYGATMVILY